LIGTKSNRDGIGASLKLTSQGFVHIEQAKGGMSYMSASDSSDSLRLSKRTTIDSLEITWPSGQVDRLTNLSIDQIIAVKRRRRRDPAAVSKDPEPEMNCPRRRFLGSSLVVLAGTLLDALTTPLWKWKHSLTLQSSPSANSTSLVQFVDVAGEAGLNIPNVWGAIDHKRYIIEAKGSGIAFFDYDHDGWLDVYSRMERASAKTGPPGRPPGRICTRTTATERSPT